MFANIVVENKSKHTDNFFTYEVGDLNVNVGDRVIIPFGTKTKEGYVFDISSECNLPADVEIKKIVGRAEFGHLNSEIIRTASWMKQRYAITYYDAINLFVPNGKPPKEGKEKEPYKNLESSYERPTELTTEQKKACVTINASIELGKRDIFLVHGVTSSGKTEVYMEAIEKCLEKGKTAIMLVPEISLTRQTIERFSGRFGKENIAILHSKLTPRERFDEWTRLRTGKAKIAVGARMACFAPLDNIGLIIMDEEHEATYKADMTPKYETVDVAAKRLMFYDGVLILGSATPSVVSYQRAKDGIYKLIELKERYNKTPLPVVETIDMREELKNGNRTIFSSALYNYISSALENKKQVILLQNRRGYSNFVSCRDCGSVIKCDECGISLTYHKANESLVCHYCGRKFPVPKTCPTCKGKHIKYFGIGTEQVEEEVEKLFPNAKLERLDLDSISNRTELDRILDSFEKHETDILVGTQLVAKGLDFDNVAVVGVISADTTLNIPDFRSSERTYQLITQVAGRAGRGSEQGRVVVQTYEPGNFVFKACENNDYNAFFTEEAKLRGFMDYPPFGDIICVNFTSDNDQASMTTAERCEAYMRTALGNEGKGRILSPKLSTHFKGKDAFRHYIILKCPKGERNKYVYYLDEFSKIILEERINCNVNIDVNPYSTF